MSDTPETTADPTRTTAPRLTVAERRGIKILADHIRFELYTDGRADPQAMAWRERNEAALAVIKERVGHE